MTPRERRNKILIQLACYPSRTMQQLADDLGVSRRTIYRDIIELSLTEPIYTMRGKYNGGVYLADNFHADWSSKEIELMHRLLDAANREICKLSPDEYTIVSNFIIRNSLPRVH